jgi:hypothetical protein
MDIGLITRLINILELFPRSKQMDIIMGIVKKIRDIGETEVAQELQLKLTGCYLHQVEERLIRITLITFEV